jgi:hypothetical protein
MRGEYQLGYNSQYIYYWFTTCRKNRKMICTIGTINRSSGISYRRKYDVKKQV